jgi:uncharacterized heparinase superfamily protein
MNVARLLRTVRYLKPEQIVNRITRRLAPTRLRLGPPLEPRARLGVWTPEGGRSPSMTGPDTFRFLNQAGRVATASGWNDPAQEKLWLYNLHYFDDLAAEGAAGRAAWHQALIARWIAENPPGHGNGWEPYPLSLRIANWIKFDLGGGGLSAGARESLANQARALEGLIEYHLLGNHIFANAKALIFAGAYFEGPEADRLFGQGVEVLNRELNEQILSDGGHFERSPMYHAIILEDVLDLLALARVFPDRLTAVCGKLRERAPRMLDWLAAMTHPDGGIAFFNDAAFGIAPPTADIFHRASLLGLTPPPMPKDGLTVLDPSGYVRMQRGGAVAILDTAPIGPDYLPGHAHADTLSFELSLGGARVIVNGGTSAYGLGPQRERERATASHSTLQIADADSSEVWAGFRVGRRARVFDRVAHQDAEACTVAASHDGYRALPGRPIHRRAWTLTARGLSVVDAVVGGVDGASGAVARFHMHPDVQVAAAAGAREGVLTAGGRAIAWSTNGSAAIQASQWRPEFGKRVPAQQLAIAMTGATLTADFSW